MWISAQWLFTIVARERDQHVKQNIRAEHDVIATTLLGGMMTHTTDAWNKYHAGLGNGRYHLRIMNGTAM